MQSQEKSENSGMKFLEYDVNIIISVLRREKISHVQKILPDCCIKKYACREGSQIYKELEVSQEGLSPVQAEVMRERYGVNSFAHQKKSCQSVRLLRKGMRLI